MKVSLNAVKEFTEVSASIDEIVTLIGARLGGIDEVIDFGARYEGATIVKVVKCEKHPDADKLSLCMIDAGQKELIQVVCGAPNVREGMLAVWLPPGATVPSTFDKDPFVLEARELRGKKSNGMLASPKELAFGDSHEGLLVVDDGKPGDSFAKVYGLDDYIIDIENKMFTHRPDCFGQLGVAREVAGIQHKAFTSPDWYLSKTRVESAASDDLGIKLSVKTDKVNGFIAVAIGGVEIKPSPLWLQAYLTRLGVKPISNIVDITNYMMMQTAQPMHAYDYDKLGTGTLGVREARQGESLKILGGKTIRLEDGDIVITDGNKPVGLGGIIGGADTDVDSKTKNIVLECATFDMNTIRRSAMKHGLFTDATTRFTKGQSPAQKDPVVHQAAALIKELSGGTPVAAAVHPNGPAQKKPLHVSAGFISERLGLKLDAAEIKKLLENVECGVSLSGTELTVTAPFWRTDIEIPEDVVEEVGRLYGYDRLPLVMPARTLSPAVRDPLLDLKAAIREQLSKTGANEVLTYSFVHGDLLEKTGQDKAKAFEIANALSPDLQYYRLSLMPSLLEKIHPNIKAGYNEFALFEIGKTHSRDLIQQDGLPGEFECTALVVTAADKLKLPGAPYYQAKTYLEALTRTDLVFKPVSGDALKYPIVQPYDPDRSALVSIKGGEFLGIIGEFKPSVAKALKLPRFTAGFEVDTNELRPLFQDRTGYMPLSRFPGVKQDITLKVAATLDYAPLYDFLDKELGLQAPDNTFTSLEPIDIYQKEGDAAHKQLTFRASITSNERTLTDKAVAATLDKVAEAAKAKYKTERI
jgi:phenylalanyl-tRNA synthetase beta chain